MKTIVSSFNVFFALLLFGAFASAGCARLNSIHRGKSLPDDKGHILSVDAKQRAILSVPIIPTNAKGEAQPILRFCSEPPPDVFTAIATGYGIRALLGRDKTRNEIDAEIQQTISENAATIGKTQTVNILREMMFRNCERFLSGAIGTEEFIVQAARDQRAIVHVLAVEQLTGAARTQSAALTTLAKSAASGTTGESIQSLTKARADAQSSQTAADKSKADAIALPPAGPCQSGKDAYKESGASEDEIKSKNGACQQSTKADADAKTAADHYATVKKAVDRQEALSTEAGGDAKAIASSAEAISRYVADAVVEIVKLNNGFSELEMTCVVMLRNASEDHGTARILQMGNSSFKDTCLELLRAKGAYEEAQLREDTLAIRRAVDKQIEGTLNDAMNVWKAISDASGVDADALSVLEAKAGLRIATSVKKQMLESKSAMEFNAAFNQLTTTDREDLKAAISSP